MSQQEIARRAITPEEMPQAESPQSRPILKPFTDVIATFETTSAALQTYGAPDAVRMYDNRARKVVSQAATSMDVFHSKPGTVENAEVLQIGIEVIRELDEKIGVARERLGAVETMRTIFDKGGAFAIEDRLTAARATQLRQTERALGENAKSAGEIINKSQTQITELDRRNARVANAANLLTETKPEFTDVAHVLITLDDREVRNRNTITTQSQKADGMDKFLAAAKQQLKNAENHLAQATLSGENIDEIRNAIARLTGEISDAESSKQAAVLAVHEANVDQKKIAETELPVPAKRMVELRAFVKGRIAEGLDAVLPSNVFAHNDVADYGHLDNFSLPHALQNFQGNVDRLRREYGRATSDETADSFTHKDYVAMFNLAVTVFQEHRVHVDALKTLIIRQMTLSGIKMVADSHAKLADSARTWATTHTAQIAEGAIVRSDVGTELNRIADMCRLELHQLETAKRAVVETAEAHSSAAKVLQVTIENQREMETLKTDLLSGRKELTKRKGRMNIFGKKNLNTEGLKPSEDISEEHQRILNEAVAKVLVASDIVGTERAGELFDQRLSGVATTLQDRRDQAAQHHGYYRRTAERHAVAIQAAATAGLAQGMTATAELQEFIEPFRKLGGEIAASDGRVLAEMITQDRRQTAGQIFAKSVLAVGGTPAERVVAAWQVLIGNRSAAVARAQLGAKSASAAVASVVALEAAAKSQGNDKK